MFKGPNFTTYMVKPTVLGQEHAQIVNSMDRNYLFTSIWTPKLESHPTFTPENFLNTSIKSCCFENHHSPHQWENWI